MAIIKAFYEQYMDAGSVGRFSVPSPNKPVPGLPLVLDYPIKEIDRFIVQACLRMNFSNYQKFTMIVANESGAIIAALLAAGYTPLEIAEMRSAGNFNPVDLIEAGQKLPDKLHIQKKGADHKGLRLRDAINALLCTKLGLDDPKAVVTFEMLHNAGMHTALYITVLDTTAGAIVPLSFENFPAMAVADAVLASCAVQPYITAVTIKMDDGNHSLMSCSNKQALPLCTAASLFKSKNMTGNFQTLVVGYGCSHAVNEAGSKNATGTDLYKHLLSTRATVQIPPGTHRGVILI